MGRRGYKSGDEVEIRPLLASDVRAAFMLAVEAITAVIPEDQRPDPDDPVRHLRLAHLQRTDPEGCWLATIDGEPVGVSAALIREGVWGLSLLAVAEGMQSLGIGRRLMEPTLAYGDGSVRGGIICSSTDPRAMRRYARAGFDLHPTVAAAGIIDRERVPPGLDALQAPSMPEAVERAAPISRAVRGGAHGEDVGVLIEMGSSVLFDEDRGFVAHVEGVPVLLAALDERSAERLLWGALAAGPRGGTVHVDHLTSGQDWAIRVVLEAGLALSPEGPLYTRGELGPMRPYIPSGFFL